MMAFLLLALLGADPTATREIQTTHATTAHYEVLSEGPDAAEVGQMLEQLHADLLRFFKRKPKGRLKLQIFANMERFQAALARDGQKRQDAGGYYAPESRTAYLFVQPSDYFTRQLILHEATHQFHFLARANNNRPQALWYVEGLAEYFGMHNWDGRVLKTGVVPAITLEDYPAKAQEQYKACGNDFEGIVTGRIEVDRPLAWSMVRFLMLRHPRRFRALSIQLDRGRDPKTAWSAAIGKTRSKWIEEYRQWLLENAQPWHEVWRAWQQRGEVLEGWADNVVGLAVLKATPLSLEAELKWVHGKILRAGLVVGYQSPDDFQLFEIVGDREAWIIRRSKGRWLQTRRYQIPPSERWTLCVLCRGDGKRTLQVNGTEVATVLATGQVGLVVENGCVEFRVKIKPTPKPNVEPTTRAASQVGTISDRN